MRLMRLLSVLKLVSRPPSQRLQTYGMPTRCGLLLDGLLALLLGADEEDAAATLGGLLEEVVGLVDEDRRLLQVDDVDAAALAEDVLLHLGVPAAGLVAEVDAAREQVLHAHGVLGCRQDCLLLKTVAGGASPARERRRHTPPSVPADGQWNRAGGALTRRLPPDTATDRGSAGSGWTQRPKMIPQNGCGRPRRGLRAPARTFSRSRPARSRRAAGL